MNLSNFSQIRHSGKDITLAKLNGDIVYRRETDVPVEPIEKEYAIEYTIKARNSSDTLTAKYTTNSTNYFYYLPRINNSDMTSWSISGYDKIEITKTDGTITDDISTLASKVEKIKVWYPKTTPRIYFYGYSIAYPCYITKVLNSTKMNTTNLTNMNSMFYYCTSLTSLDLSDWDTSNVTSMNSMFYYCSALKSLDLSDWDTSNVTSMNSMFYECRNLTSLDLSSFNTSNVTNMSYMFSGINVTKLSSLNLSNWDMTKTTSYGTMFNTSLSYIPYLNHIDLSNSNSTTITKIASRLYARTKATYGEMLIPEATSQSAINSVAAKYWKPVGPIIHPTSFEIASDLDEIVGLGKVTRFYYGNYEPWYTEGEVELFSSDNTISYINENNELVSAAYGSVEVYGRLKEDNSIVSNTITISISETDSYPNVIKFIGDTDTPGKYNYIKVNGTNVQLTDMTYNSLTNIYTYDVGSPITSIKFNGSGNIIYGNIKELIKLNITNLTNMYAMFSYCSSLTSLDVSNWDTGNVNSMSWMFAYCSSLTSLDLSNWDISNVTDMQYMFYRCASLSSLDLSNWDTSKVGQKYYMLGDTPLDIDFHYNGNNYENWSLTEEDCGYIGIYQWNLPTDLQYSDDYYTEYRVLSIPEPLDYLHIRKLGIPAVCINGRQTYNFQKIEITKNDGSKTDDTSTPCNLISSVRVYYPEKCEKVTFEGLQEYTRVDSKPVDAYYNFFTDTVTIRTDNFTDMSNMFYNCNRIYQINCTDDTSNVTNMHGMFYGCQGLNSLNLSNFNTSNVTDMSNMFTDCTSLTSLDLSSFNTINVTRMDSMFYYCKSLTSLNLSSFDTSNVYSMSYMFSECSASIYGGYKFAIRGSCNYMFEYFSGSIYDIGYGDVYDASYMFANSNIDDYTFSNIFYYSCNFSGCSNMSYMFYNCTNLSSFYFNNSSYHSTHSLYDVSYMFAGCTNLYELYINYMNTQNVYNYEGMFADVSDSCNIYVGSDFTLAESDTGFNGYFQYY